MAAKKKKKKKKEHTGTSSRMGASWVPGGTERSAVSSTDSWARDLSSRFRSAAMEDAPLPHKLQDLFGALLAPLTSSVASTAELGLPGHLTAAASKLPLCMGMGMGPALNVMVVMCMIGHVLLVLFCVVLAGSTSLCLPQLQPLVMSSESPLPHRLDLYGAVLIVIASVAAEMVGSAGASKVECALQLQPLYARAVSPLSHRLTLYGVVLASAAGVVAGWSDTDLQVEIAR